jgi:hypothetical protein
MKIRLGPAGLLIFSRKTGGHALVDEVSVPSGVWSRAPRHVSIALTNACDLQCAYCYAPKHPARLLANELESWLTELDRNGSLGIGFGGGEPTLSRDLVQLCRYLTDHTGMACSFTTHGHHIDDRLAADLQGSVNFIRVSMDGVGKTYERLRRRPFGSLRSKLELIGGISAFGINYVINSETISDLDAAVRIAEQAGATEFLLLPEHGVGERTGADASTLARLRTWVDSYCAAIPLSVSEAGAEGLPTCDPLAMERGLRAFAHIDASGVLKKSSYDGNGVRIGQGGVMEALETLLDGKN